MKSNSPIAQELQLLAPLLAKKDYPLPYDVQEGYFDELTLRLLQAVHSHSSGITTPNHGPVVPEGYFDQLPSQVLSKIKEQEISEARQEIVEIAPTLSSLNRTLPYETPRNYFPSLQPMEMVAASMPGKKVVRLSTNIWRVAAGVLVVLACLAIWQLSRPAWNQNSSTQAASAADNSAMDSEMLSHALEQLDDETLQSSLSDAGVGTDAQSILPMYFTTNFEEALQSFSSEDLAAHLEEINIIQPNDNKVNL